MSKSNLGTLKGIFEPFKDYVQKQLRVRKVLLANSHQAYLNQELSDRQAAQAGVSEVTVPAPKEHSYGFQLNSRADVYSEDSFYGYTVEKQCIIRMMSGVDLRNNAGKNILQEEAADPKLKYLLYKGNLAKQYILESGTQYYNEQGEHGGLREGFIPDSVAEDYKRAFSYGDKNIRANADKDYGIVPMPGITDAEIRTKSDNGSLREASVNFVCHNRRQLEVLELLYMRPGYPICLEWGWNPYINNDGHKKENLFSVREEFFDEKETLESLNEAIREFKEEAGGNFDGFIGYCKNFSFKANDVGGYNCTTEIIAHGEIIESLKSQKTTINTPSLDEKKQLSDLEIHDSLLFYLRSIKNTMRTPQDIQYLRHLPTKGNSLHGTPASQTASVDGEDQMNDGNNLNDPTWDEMRTELGYAGDGCPTYFRNNKLLSISYTSDEYFTCVYENNVSIPVYIQQPSTRKSHYKIGDDIFNVKVEGWQPQPYDLNLLVDENEKVTLTKDYLSNMSYEQYKYMYESGQEGAHNTDGGDMMHYSAIKAGNYFAGGLLQLNGNLNDFFFSPGGYKEWGIQRYSITNKGIQNQMGDFDPSLKKRKENMDDFSTKLTLIDQKLQNYRKGYLDIKNMVTHIVKENYVNGKSSYTYNFQSNDYNTSLKDKEKYAGNDWNRSDLPDKRAGIGFESFLHGSIVKQTVKLDETAEDSGYRRNIFVRWDLLCQMINHLSTYRSERLSDFDSKDLYGENKKTKLLQNYYNNYSFKHPEMELTYMNPNSPTWNNNILTKPRQKLANAFYLPYTPPYVTDTDPVKNMIIPDNQDDNQLLEADWKKIKSGYKSTYTPHVYDIENRFGEDVIAVSNVWGDNTYIVKDGVEMYNVLPENAKNMADGYVPYSSNKKLTVDDYHPLIGISLDDSICLMPHQGAFDTMFNEDKVYFDSTIASVHQKDADSFVSNNLKFPDSIDRQRDKYRSQEVDFKAICSYLDKNGKDIADSSDRHSVGFVYLNLDYVIKLYEDQRLRDIKQQAMLQPHTTLNKDFNFYDYITAIWDGVNSACGNHYNFTLHTEHERPHVNRIIDLRVSGNAKEIENQIYTFEPQGLRTVVRQFYYDSAISNDLASMIAIAASDPKDMNQLDSLSFKAFNKDIKNRFNSDDEVDTDASNKVLKEKLENDVEKYQQTFDTLVFYMTKMHEGNRQTEFMKMSDDYTIASINTGTAMNYIHQLRELRTNINNRVPLQDSNGKDNDGQEGRDFAGRWLTEVTNEISPIIPIQFNIQLDGIAGLIPLQLFKVDPERLPIGYQADNIGFVIKSETQKITNSQDWIVEISGQMCILDNNKNTGNNTISERPSVNMNNRISGTVEEIGSVVEEANNKNADAVRDYIKMHGHKERDHRGSKKGYPDAELSSHGDITPSLRDFIIDFIITLADKHPKMKLEFTGGNDIYHQKPKFAGSKHRVGRGVDFIFRGSNNLNRVDKMLDLLKEMKADKYPKLYIKDEYRMKNHDDGRHKDVYGRPYANAPAHIHLQL